MTITELFFRFRCNNQEKNELLDYLQYMRITNVIKEIKNIKDSIANNVNENGKEI